MKLVLRRSAARGATPAARRVLEGVSTTSSAPTLASQGTALRGPKKVYLQFEVGGTTPSFTVVVWEYSHVSQRWQRTPSVFTVTDNARETPDLVGGPSRVYLQITAATGTTPTLNAWIEEVNDAP